MLKLISKLISKPSPSIAKRLQIEGIDNSFKYNEASIKNLSRVALAIDSIEKMNESNIVFHGFNSIESFCKILVEHGIAIKEFNLNKCLQILIKSNTNNVLYTKGLTKVGSILDRNMISGSKSIKASILAHAGIENNDMVYEGIEKALKAFAVAGSVRSINEISVFHKGKHVFIPNVSWPDYYDLKVLAFTNSWKNETNKKLLKDAITNTISFQPIPNIYLLHKNQLIAPGSFLMHSFDYDVMECTDSEFYEWIIRSDFLARMGALPKSIIQSFNQLTENEGRLIMRISKLKPNTICMKWGAYTGISLEENWKSKISKVNDILFRLVLIEKYIGLSS
jgi:hypothetical protein